MRYSTLFTALLAAATTALALALPVAPRHRAADNEALYERGLENIFWSRDLLPRGPPRPLPKPPPRPLPQPPPRPLPQPPMRMRARDSAAASEARELNDALVERSFDDGRGDVFWARDVLPRGPPRPLPKPPPRPLPNPPPRPLPVPPRRRCIHGDAGELLERVLRVDELD